MMKYFLTFCTILFVILTSSAADTGVHIYYIAGWATETKQLDEQMKILHRIFPEAAEIKRLEWRADGDFPSAVRTADRKAEEIAAKIENLPLGVQQNLILIGHSLGGRMVIRIMAKLQKKKIHVKKGIFLGAAIDYDDPDICFSLPASTEQNILVYQPKDILLRDEYSSCMNTTAALGSRGYCGKYDKAKLRHIRLDRKLPVSEAHHSMNYLECLKEKITSAVDEAPLSEIHGFRNELKYPDKTILFFQKEIKEYRGWKILLPRGNALVKWVDIYNKIHVNYILCDPEMRCRARGSLQEMQEALEDVKKILDAK